MMTVKELVNATGMRRNPLDQLLYKMAKDGQIHKVMRGRYVHPDRADLQPPSKNDKKIRNHGKDYSQDG